MEKKFNFFDKIINDKLEDLTFVIDLSARGDIYTGLSKTNSLKVNYNIANFSQKIKAMFKEMYNENLILEKGDIASLTNSIPNVDHIASDLSGDFIADVTYNITQIPEKENTFDLIVCYHILEHVIEDVKAMSELHRVLKPTGTVVIQTPFKEGDIYEDYTITSETERLLHFGQEDHVRIYALDGLKKRLESVGFTIVVNQYKKDEDLGFSENEIVILATK
jgi:SAM-dependent methyltransferase